MCNLTDMTTVGLWKVHCQGILRSTRFLIRKWLQTVVFGLKEIGHNSEGFYMTVLLVWLYSQSMSCMTSISKNEMNIQIPFCNVQHLNGILRISLVIFLKKTR